MNSEIDVKKYVNGKLPLQKSGNVTAYPVSENDIVKVCKELYFKHNLPLKTITVADNRKENGGFVIYYIFGIPGKNLFLAPFLVVKDKEEFPSLTRDIHEASNYERKIKTFFGLTPVGHHSPRRILLQENWPEGLFPLRKDFDWQTRPADTDVPYQFRQISGEGVYEIPVGPVHAGIIEPGHFRFSVLGEEILSLEAKLGYTHKGAEKLFENLSLKDAVQLSERISGDTSFTHSMAFCQALENLLGIEIPARAKYLRVIFSELERLANHFNDIGFITLDAGFNFGGAHCSRLREVIMQWNERLSGSRFLRGVNKIGGVTRNIDDKTNGDLLSALSDLHQDFIEVIDIAKSSSSLLNRLLGTGILDSKIAKNHGVTGLAGRALDIPHDARKEYPYAAYDKIKFNIALEKGGDVHARWSVRIQEVFSSLIILKQALKEIPAGNLIQSDHKQILPKNSFSVGIAEGWRGDIVYFVVTDSAGQINRVDVRDPSFINWAVLGYAAKDNVVADFPLINKSFNLSYSGNDV